MIWTTQGKNEEATKLLESVLKPNEALQEKWPELGEELFFSYVR